MEVKKGTKNGAVDSKHRASKGRGLQLQTKIYHFKFLYTTFINITHAIIFST
jgi:hypothetical protein